MKSAVRSSWCTCWWCGVMKSPKSPAVCLLHWLVYKRRLCVALMPGRKITTRPGLSRSAVHPACMRNARMVASPHRKVSSSAHKRRTNTRCTTSLTASQRHTFTTLIRRVSITHPLHPCLVVPCARDQQINTRGHYCRCFGFAPHVPRSRLCLPTAARIYKLQQRSHHSDGCIKHEHERAEVEMCSKP